MVSEEELRAELIRLKPLLHNIYAVYYKGRNCERKSKVIMKRVIKMLIFIFFFGWLFMVMLAKIATSNEEAFEPYDLQRLIVAIPILLLVGIVLSIFYKIKAKGYYASANKKMGEIRTFIPGKYLFETCIDYALELATTGRATTMPAMCDRLDEQLHRWEMEAKQDAMLSNQIAMRDELGKINSKLGVIEWNTFWN